jgi:hypothetical protein
MALAALLFVGAIVLYGLSGTLHQLVRRMSGG